MPASMQPPALILGALPSHRAPRSGRTRRVAPGKRVDAEAPGDAGRFWCAPGPRARRERLGADRPGRASSWQGFRRAGIHPAPPESSIHSHLLLPRRPPTPWCCRSGRPARAWRMRHFVRQRNRLPASLLMAYAQYRALPRAPFVLMFHRPVSTMQSTTAA